MSAAVSQCHPFRLNILHYDKKIYIQCSCNLPHDIIITVTLGCFPSTQRAALFIGRLLPSTQFLELSGHWYSVLVALCYLGQPRVGPLRSIPLLPSKGLSRIPISVSVERARNKTSLGTFDKRKINKLSFFCEQNGLCFWRLVSM